MADDVANLGLAVDSRSVEGGTKELDKFEGQAKKTDKATEQLQKRMKTLATVIKVGLIAGFAAAALATRAFIQATAEQERVVAQLEAAIASTGGAAGLTSRQLRDMASALQQVTTYGDEAIIMAQSQLLTFTNLGSNVFPRAMASVLDLSTRMGTDLTSSVVQLGKALNDPIANLSALSRAGIQFSDAQKEMIKGLWEAGRAAEAQSLILDELEKQFGGSARAARNTMGGALQGLGNAWGDLFELQGDATAGMIGNINDLTSTLSSDTTRNAFQTFGNWMISALNAGVQAAVNAIGAIDAVIQATRQVGDQSDSHLADMARSSLDLVGDGIGISVQDVLNSEQNIQTINEIYKREVAEMNATLATVGQTGPLELGGGGLGGGGGGSSSALGQLADKMLEDAERIKEAIRTPNEELAFQMDYLRELLWAGALSWEEYSRAVSDAMEAVELDTGAVVGKVGEILGSLSSILESTGKENFAITKGLSVAMAVLKGYEAVTSAYAAGAAIPGGGPITGALYAAAAAAATAAQIANILSTNSNSTSMKGSAGGSTPSVPQAAAPTRSTTVNLSLHGNSYSKESIEEMLRGMEASIDDGFKVNLVGT